MVERKVAALGLIAAAMIWAVTGVSFKIFLDRGFSLIFILWVILIFKYTSVWLISDFKGVKHELVMDKRELRFILLNGFFVLCTPIFFLLAIQRTSLSNAYFTVYTAPAWVLIGSVLLLGEKIDAKKIVGLVFTFIGLVFVSRPENLLSFDFGIFLALLAAFSFAGDIITSREMKDYPYHTVAIYGNAFQLVVLTILVLFVYGIPAVWSGFLLAGILAVIGLFRGVSADLYYYALEKLEASTASIISLSELIFASVLSYLLLNEVPAPEELIGYVFIILSGIIILLRTSDIHNFEYLLRLRRKH